MAAAAMIYIPFVLSFFTHKTTFPCRNVTCPPTQCHRQLFYRPKATLPSDPALFSCVGPLGPEHVLPAGMAAK